MYRIRDLKTSDLKSPHSPAILRYENFKHYVDYFNRMEDENIIQAVPNSKANEWMEKNIPLFECPSGQFRRNVLFSLVDTKKTHQKNPYRICNDRIFGEQILRR